MRMRFNCPAPMLPYVALKDSMNFAPVFSAKNHPNAEGD